MIKLSEILEIYKSEDVKKFLEKYYNVDLDKKGIKFEDVKENFSYVGDNESNMSIINMLSEGNKGLIERITNGIDAVLQKKVEENHLDGNITVEKLLKKVYPDYYEHMFKTNSIDRLLTKDAANLVTVVVNDGSRISRPTIDVVDKGVGLTPQEFKNTILSLNHGNKIKEDTKYMIGTFGQGGSTSLSFANETIIISKKNNAYSFTIVKKAFFKGFKGYSYIYLKMDNDLAVAVENDLDANGNDYIQEFIESDSGTFVRMIESDISQEYRQIHSTKPGGLYDYINTEIFKSPLPIKVIENRKNYQDVSSSQNRNSFGNSFKLKNYKKNVIEKYSGQLQFVHNDTNYKINYYAILPTEKEKWGNDAECRKVFKWFNVHETPIIYTVSGQYINGELFTKLKNSGLSFLKYRLLVVVDLDDLEDRKYQFFTSNRSEVVKSDLTRGFLDTLVSNIKDAENIKELNSLISELSVRKGLDDDELQRIIKNVKNKYKTYGNMNEFIINTPGHSGGKESNNDYGDDIEKFLLSTTKNRYYKDQKINFVVTTNAQKYVNTDVSIDFFIDDASEYNYTRINMNGRIQFSISGLEVGSHKLEIYGKKDNMSYETNTFDFEVLDENSPEGSKEKEQRGLNLDVVPVDGKDYIIDISKTPEKITVYYCFDCDDFQKVFIKKTETETNEYKKKLMEPLVLFSLYMGDYYCNIENEKERNKIIVPFITSIINSDIVK